MNPLSTLVRRALVPVGAACLALALAAPAQAHRGWGLELALGLPWVQLQVGVPLPAGEVSVQVGGVWHRHHRGHGYLPWGARWIIVAPPLVLPAPWPGEGPLGEAPPPARPPADLPAAPVEPAAGEPDVEALQGQSASQTEADRRDCERLATTEPAAMADAGVFHRSVLACLRGRGYAVR